MKTIDQLHEMSLQELEEASARNKRFIIFHAVCILNILVGAFGWYWSINHDSIFGTICFCAMLLTSSFLGLVMTGKTILQIIGKLPL